MPDLFSFTHAHTYAYVSVCVCVLMMLAFGIAHEQTVYWHDCGFESDNPSAHEGVVREKTYGEQRDCITCTL